MTRCFLFAAVKLLRVCMCFISDSVLVSSASHRIFPARLKDSDPLEAICQGCGPECSDCVVPDVEPICTDTMEHSISGGGDTGVEDVIISTGYWRATSSSQEVLACYNPEACRGGLTGTPDFCTEGYEGACG